MILARNPEASLQLPPQNIEAEEAILGGILLDPEALSRVKDLIEPEVFSIRSHQIIYQAALTVEEKGKTPDLMNVATYLADVGLLERVGGQPKLVQLVERTVSAINIDQYAQLILEKYYRRQLIDDCYELQRLAHEESLEKVTEVAELVFKRVVEPRYSNQKEGLLAKIQRVNEIESPIEQWFRWNKLSKETGYSKKSLIQLAMAAESDKELEVYSAKDFSRQQLVEVQYLVDGLLKFGTLAMIAAEGKTGKSLWHYNLSHHVATGTDWGEFSIKEAHKTLIVQTDETRIELKERLLLRGLSELNNVEVMPSFTPYQLARLKRKIKEENFKFIVLDSLTSINRYSGYSPNDAEYGYFVYELSELASELGVCILLVHHTSKCPLSESLDKVAGSAVITRAPSDIFLLSRSKERGEDTIRILTHLASRSAGRTNWKLAINQEDGSYTYIGRCSLEGDLEADQEEGTADYSTKIQHFLEQNAPTPYEASEIANYLDLQPARTRLVCGRLFSSGRIARKKSSVNPRAWAYFFPQVIAEGSGDHLISSAITSRNAGSERDSSPSDRVIAKNFEKFSPENSSEKFLEKTSDHAITSMQTPDTERNTASDRVEKEVIALAEISPDDHLNSNIALQSRDNSLQESSNTSLQSEIEDYVSLLKDAVDQKLDREVILALVEGIDPNIKEEVWMSLTLPEREYIKQVIQKPSPPSPQIEPKVNDQIEQRIDGEWQTCGIIHRINYRGRHPSKYLVAWRSGRTSEHTLEEIYGLGWRVWQSQAVERLHKKAPPAKLTDKQKKYLERDWINQGYIILNWRKIDGSKALQFELERSLTMPDPDADGDWKFTVEIHQVWVKIWPTGRIEPISEKIYGPKTEEL
jgi:archaellum biogenesis ATPase FlaH